MSPDAAEGAPDVIVVGGGAVGENVADYAVRGGLTAMIIESELLGGECLAEGAGITLRRGVARLVGPRTVRVGDEEITARRAGALCTGSVPVRPDVPGWTGCGSGHRARPPRPRRRRAGSG